MRVHNPEGGRVREEAARPRGQEHAKGIVKGRMKKLEAVVAREREGGRMV